MQAPVEEPSRDPIHVLRAAVGAAVMAPSSHNTQPWRFRISGATLDILVDRERHLGVIDVARRQQITSCGCALFNARVAVRAMGFKDEVTVMFCDNDIPDHLATLHLGARREVTPADMTLIKAVGQRRTNRRPFLHRPVPPMAIEALEHAVKREGVSISRLDPDRKHRFARLVEEADHVQFADPAFREELGQWLNPVGSRRRDGIPFEEKEYGSTASFALVKALRSPALGDLFGQLEEQRIVGAPVVFVLGTHGDDPSAWLTCGEALEALLLHATALGLSAAFFNQVLEVPELRTKVSELVPEVGYPQMVLRIGVPSYPVEHVAPRRNIDEVLEVVD